MIIVFHDRKKVTKVFDFEKNQELSISAKTIQKTLFNLASQNKERILCWCHLELENSINQEILSDIFHHNLIMASYSTSGKFVIPSAAGYVEDSTYLKIQHDVTYPTWLMSSDVGGIHAKVLIEYKKLVCLKMCFDEFLNHVGMQGIRKGLFCYSDPRLLKESLLEIHVNKKEQISVFSFLVNYYSNRLIVALFFNYLVYENRFKVLGLLKALLFPKKSYDILDFSKVKVKSNYSHKDFETNYDVLIPTLGRAKVLKDVLLDLTQHTILPKKVIIVEQNGLPNSKTELNYIYNQEWPFEIDHTFIHQLGACNARNIALRKIESQWVFFADDDIRLTKTLIANAFQFIKQYGVSALNMASLRKGEVLKQTFPIQWYGFSTNSSFVKTSAIKNITFGMEHEFGFGEDSDFGMKIRNKGTDVIFYPNSEIVHLKAPVGGFRAKIDLPWDNEEIQPKPSPMVLAHRIKHTTKEQLLGYKTVMFFKFFKEQKNKNPFSYISYMRKRWRRSEYWAKLLIDKYNGI